MYSFYKQLIKHSKSCKLILGLIQKTLIVYLFILLISNTVFCQTNIVAFGLTSNNSATAYITGNSGCLLTTNASGVAYGGSGANATGWNGGSLSKAWSTTKFITNGYVGLTVSAQMKSDNTGPRDFKIQYSFNGSAWTDVGYNITLTTSLTNYSTTLPVSLENNSSVYVRWIMRSNTAVNGGAVLSSGKSYIYGIDVAGNLPAAPSEQSSYISIVAVTSTTITIGCTNGNGTNRIFEINNSNSFGSYSVNNNNPTANSVYSGSGEQVVYNGTGSEVTVTVPSATDIYWFRVYDYNYNSGLIRYNTSTATDNPKECALETIINPTYSNIGDTNAVLGGTIVTPTVGTIIDRGVYWSTSPGVNDNDTQESEGGLTGGTFTFEVTDLLPNSTIYFKAYVTNEYGTILSDESSFSNLQPPVPTGSSVQSFCNSATVADLVATGSSILWYNDTIGGTSLPTSTTLINNHHYFASQTVGGLEGHARLKVLVNIFTPSLGGTVSGSASVCSGSNSGTLSESGYNGSITRWQSCSLSDFSSGVNNISNITTSQNYNNLSSTTYYRCEVTNGVCPSDYSSVASVNVSSSIPLQPGSITGSVSVCSGQSGVNYSISAVAGATSYTWGVPSGASITSGAGTNSITVTFGSTSGNITVTADNACGSSTVRSTAITVNSIPAQPGAISGITTVNSGQSGVVYSISSVSGATSYNWSLPSGSSITSGSGTNSITVTFGSVSGNILVSASNSCGASASTSQSITVNVLTSYNWTAGGHNTNWNDPANWNSSSVPDRTNDIIIPSNPAGGNIFPAVNIANAECKTITINNGASVTVNSGKNLNVYGDFTNNGSSTFGSGKITFCGSAAQSINGTNTFTDLTINNSNGLSLSGTTNISDVLTTTSGTLTTNNNLTLLSDSVRTAVISGTGSGTVSGNVNVRKYLGSNNYQCYWYISSPVNCTFQQIVDNLPVTGWGSVYRLDQWSNLWEYDETDTSQVQHTQGVWMNGWVSPSASNQSMIPMKGYAVYVNDDKTLTLQGPVNSGSYTFHVTHTSSIASGGSPQDDGWNFVGNPYPCSIDWQASSGWSKSCVANAIYFYKSSGPFGGSYKTFVNGFGVPFGVTGVIAPMQGFFVNANTSGDITINNSARVNHTSGFNKKAESHKMFRLKLQDSKTNDLTDETIIYFDDSANKNFNPALDAYKIISPDQYQPDLYSIHNKSKMAISALPAPNNSNNLSDEEIIPLGIIIKQDGNYKLTINEFLNFSANEHVYLVDAVMNNSIDLSTVSDYEFQSAAGTFENRFYIRFSLSETVNVSNPVSNMFYYNYTEGNLLNVVYHNSSASIALLSVYNVLGQNILNNIQISNGTNKIPLQNGCYITRLNVNNKTYTKKITISY